MSFEIAEGEVFALLGPNGAGKTTIVEILEGFRTRTKGTVAVLGADPETGGRALRERIGIVLQSCGIDPFFTVEELVRATGKAYPSPRPVAEVVELVGLSDKADARVKTLSGGQQRRLDLALALVGDPELVFLDEPTTGFDPSARRASWDLIENLCRLGKTVLLTTHYMEEAQRLADRIVVIAQGRIVAEGTPETIGGRDHAATVVPLRAPRPDVDHRRARFRERESTTTGSSRSARRSRRSSCTSSPRGRSRTAESSRASRCSARRSKTSTWSSPDERRR